MSTQYSIFESERTDVWYELELNEHSGKLDLTIYRNRTGRAEPGEDLSINDLKPKQVIAIALEMIKVANYQIGDEDTIAVGKAFLKDDTGGVKALLKGISE